VRDAALARRARDAETTDGERPESLRIARGQDLVPRQEDDRVRAAHARERVRQGADDAVRARARHQVEEDLAVRARGEDRALFFQLATQLVRVDEVAVVRESQRALVGVVDDRLGVLEKRLSRRRVADVADGGAPRKPRDASLVEEVVDVPHPLLDEDAAAVPRRDAGGFLPAVLEGVQAEVGQVRGVAVAVDPEHTALFPELVVGHVRILSRVGRPRAAGMR